MLFKGCAQIPLFSPFLRVSTVFFRPAALAASRFVFIVSMRVELLLIFQ
jgi:hypothetical protein